MADYSTNEFRAGLKILLDNEPCEIIENEMVKPGKGQAFNRIKAKNLLSGRVLERTFKSGERLAAADTLEVEAQFLYNDGHEWHFMNKANYEQYLASGEAVAEAGQWLRPEDMCAVILHNNVPIRVTPPNFVELAVKETAPGVRGDTAAGGVKPATLETGALVKVPLFIEESDILRIDTRRGAYVGRVKRS